MHREPSWQALWIQFEDTTVDRRGSSLTPALRTAHLAAERSEPHAPFRWFRMVLRHQAKTSMTHSGRRPNDDYCAYVLCHMPCRL